ncbi:MAG: hypothetical protein IPJ19_11085 [Planctomycetes bacterium]|nr:hypothetical protein [Planctomycetota bacterium]
MMLLSTLIALPLLACPPAAGGFDRAQIDAQAKWVAHLDLEAFQATQLFQQVKAADKEGELDRGLAELAQQRGLDLFGDVFSLTVYGTDAGKENGVVIVQGSDKLDAAVAKLRDEQGGRTLQIAGHDCLQWGKGEHADGFSSLSSLSGTQRRQLVLAKSQVDLEHALAVLDKQRPSLDAAPQSDLYAAPAAGTFAFAAASGILDEIAGTHGHEVQQFSAAARLTKGVRFELGENSGSLFADLSLRTERPEDALKLKKIFDGLLVLPGLVMGDTEAGESIERLTQAVHIEALNQLVHLHFQYGAAALFAEFQALKDADLDGEHATKQPK